jgi:hypothetical protein
MHLWVINRGGGNPPGGWKVWAEALAICVIARTGGDGKSVLGRSAW